MIQRIVNLPKNHSFFLFGARGTGKTFLFKEIFTAENSLYLDLLDSELFDELVLQPNSLLTKIDELPEHINWIVLDEVQKIPKLLDLVHLRIEEGNRKEKKKVNFAITGSSARKLKRGGANLLAGRAFLYNLFPLTSFELGENFNLIDALSYGTLPLVYHDTSSRENTLRTYANAYLKEEIQQEQILRKLEPFLRFLPVAAQMDGNIVNFAALARESRTSDTSVQSYFQILEDTYIGFLLEPFHYSLRKRQTKSPKFYFFDCGVRRALAKIIDVPLQTKTFEFGMAFESFLINEIYRLQNYLQKDYTLSYLRTKDDAEIDLIIERPGMPIALIEIKSTNNITEQHVTSLQKFAKDFDKCDAFCLSLDPKAKKFDSVYALPWQQGLSELGLSVNKD